MVEIDRIEQDQAGQTLSRLFTVTGLILCCVCLEVWAGGPAAKQSIKKFTINDGYLYAFHLDPSHNGLSTAVTELRAPEHAQTVSFDVASSHQHRLAWGMAASSAYCVLESGRSISLCTIDLRGIGDLVGQHPPRRAGETTSPQAMAIGSRYSLRPELPGFHQWASYCGDMFYDLNAIGDTSVEVYIYVSGQLSSWSFDPLRPKKYAREVLLPGCLPNRSNMGKGAAYTCPESRPFRALKQGGKTYICFQDSVYWLDGAGLASDGTMSKLNDARTDLVIVDNDSGWNYCYANGEVRVLAHPHIKAKVEPVPAQEGQDEQARKDAQTLHIVKTALALPKPQAAKQHDTRTYVAYYVGGGLIVIAVLACLIWRRRRRRQSSAA